VRILRNKSEPPSERRIQLPLSEVLRVFGAVGESAQALGGGAFGGGGKVHRCASERVDSSGGRAAAGRGVVGRAGVATGSRAGAGVAQAEPVLMRGWHGGRWQATSMRMGVRAPALGEVPLSHDEVMFGRWHGLIGGGVQ
jgi:hypothetical protein